MAEPLHASAHLRIEALPRQPIVALRFVGTGWAPGDVALDSVPLPREMNRCSTGTPRAMRLGPGEWLLLGGMPDAVPASLFAVDMSHGLAAFGISGPLARALLAAASSVDFDPRVFAPGQATRTRFARTSAIVDCVGENDFRLYVDRSVAGYAAEWLGVMAPRVAAAG